MSLPAARAGDQHICPAFNGPQLHTGGPFGQADQSNDPLSSAGTVPNHSRRCQFRLRSLLVLTVVAGVCLAAYGLARRHFQQRANAVQELRDCGATVLYTSRFEPNLYPSPQPGWCDTVFGEHAFEPILTVSFRGALSQRLFASNATPIPVRGKLLHQIATFTTLQQLELASTDITDDDLHLVIRNVTELRHLDLAGTGITDGGLACLSGLRNLESLDVSGCAITDEGLESLRELTSLLELNLSATGVIGDGVKHLVKLRNLRNLSLREAPTDDRVIPYLCQLRALQTLDLAGTQVEGKQIEELRQLSRLSWLSLSSSRVSDEFAIGLRTLRGLELLDVSFTDVSPEVVNQLAEALPNCKVVW